MEYDLHIVQICYINGVIDPKIGCGRADARMRTAKKRELAAEYGVNIIHLNGA